MGKTGSKRREWRANIDEYPGLEEDLNTLRLRSGSRTNSELLSRMSLVYQHNESIDPFWKLVTKPDNLCSRSEILAKRIAVRLYGLTGVSTLEISEMMLDEFDKMKDEVSPEANNPVAQSRKTRRRSKQRDRGMG